MQKFEYDNSMKQRGEVLCYAFHADLLDASEKELKSFLAVLSQYFPTEGNPWGGKQPLHAETSLLIWNNAYSNVCRLIQERKSVSQHRQIVATSVLTVVILALTLAWSIYHTEPIGAPLTAKPSPQTTNSTNTVNPSSVPQQNAKHK
ncbi:MAG: hypothetical protein R3E73_13985 [Porticoccaceae bacterium]|nr:hypothetical protein [Pseudomonadales bacterium]MCP5170869.1 hypothetical protein [Pseudomonadales bacterium]MCP5301891.1 hypothetical protein [Pseudomonadales bacterium]